ncbi:MAG: sulfotransferase domain-containing protein [Pseudomonadota bacterium]
MRPNFFLIGAPKCGTTTVANWLSEHPQVFMPDRPKEPQYFDTDLSPHRRFRTVVQYEALFRGATSHHRAIGEASTSYLRSRVAVPEILNYQPTSRFLVMVRNPVDMAVSVHAQLVHTMYEDLTDFLDAWNAQGERARGHRIPKNTAGEQERLQYGAVCSLGTQLKRLYDLAPSEAIKVVFLDQLRDARRVYTELLSFLDLDPHRRSDFASANLMKKPRSKLIAQGLHMAAVVKRKIGLAHVSTNALELIHRLNREPVEKSPLRPEEREMLIDYFRDEIELMSRITGRNLSHWMA